MECYLSETVVVSSTVRPGPASANTHTHTHGNNGPIQTSVSPTPLDSLAALMRASEWYLARALYSSYSSGSGGGSWESMRVVVVRRCSSRPRAAAVDSACTVRRQ